MQELTADTKVDFAVNITGKIFTKYHPVMDSSDVTIKEIVKECRTPIKHGGGCPVGTIVPCPFRYKAFMDRHKGEPLVNCSDVTVDDWIELFQIMDED